MDSLLLPLLIMYAEASTTLWWTKWKTCYFQSYYAVSESINYYSSDVIFWGWLGSKHQLTNINYYVSTTTLYHVDNLCCHSFSFNIATNFISHKIKSLWQIGLRSARTVVSKFALRSNFPVFYAKQDFEKDTTLNFVEFRSCRPALWGHSGCKMWTWK